MEFLDVFLSPACRRERLRLQGLEGSFYPQKLPDGEMLPYYAARLPAVEINNTFYRMPSSAVLAGRAEQTPAPFRFAIKASRLITHTKRLKGCGDVESQPPVLALNAMDQRKQIGFRYYETGSPFEYELVRLLYTEGAGGQ